MKCFSVIVLAIFAMATTGCGRGSPPPVPAPSPRPPGQGLPDVSVATTLPQFAREVNEVQIADSFNDVDPTWVIGALVELKTGKIFAFDNYLKATAKPVVSPQTEVVFRSFVDNGVAANSQWLEFVKTEINDSTRAEVSVSKIAKVTVDSQSVNKDQLLRQLRNNKITTPADYGVVIGFTNYALSATYFKNSGAEGSVSGYGAKIGGSWYSKSEHSKLYHRIVAVWAPLPFVVEAVSNRTPGDLEDLTLDALKTKRITVQPLEVPGGAMSHIERFRPI